MPVSRNIGGAWKAASVWRNIAGTWKSGTLWRNVGGVWKAISVLFAPDGGTVSGYGVLSATATITCTQPAVWTYSTTAGSGGTVDVASGATSSQIDFTVTAGGTGSSRTDRSQTWNVSGTANGVTRNFTVTVEATGNQ